MLYVRVLFSLELRFSSVAIAPIPVLFAQRASNLFSTDGVAEGGVR